VSYGCRIDGDDVSPLHYAVDCNSLNTVSALLSARQEFPEIVSQALARVDKKKSGYAPLHNALRHRYTRVARLLIEAGADVNMVCGESVITPLELAIWTRNVDAVQLLLQSPGCQVDKVGSGSATALLHATHESKITLLCTLCTLCYVVDDCVSR